MFFCTVFDATFLWRQSYIDIFFMQADGIPVSPYSVQKALENTTVSVGDLPEDKLSTGQGLMQVDK